MGLLLVQQLGDDSFFVGYRMSLIIITVQYVVDLENLALSHRLVYSLQLEDALSPHLLQLGKVLQGWRNRHIRALSPARRRYDLLVKSTVYVHGVYCSSSK